MPILEWSTDVIGADLNDASKLSEDLAGVVARLESGADAHVVLDCAQIRYLNSSHLTQFVALLRLTESANRQFVLCAVPANVLDVLKVSGFANSFQFAADVTCALADLIAEPSS